MKTNKPIEYKIDDNGCWNCISHASQTKGYPVTYFNKIQVRIHRHYYELYKGLIPLNMVVRHTCDNRQCINPDHLILGTNADNVRDRVERNRSAKGENNGRSKLTQQQVNLIRADITSTILEIARQYNIDPKTVRDIKNNKIWIQQS